MVDRFIEGLVAGYGIAIPVGAIAILILEMSLTNGLIAGLASGAGAASADFLFAALAAVAGELLAGFLIPIQIPIRILSGLFLVVLGSLGVVRSRGRSPRSQGHSPKSSKPLKIYIQFLVLTSLNPLSLAYFSALILGRDPSDELDAIARIAFILGAGLASLSWQSLLAVMGAYGMKRMGAQFHMITIIIGNLIVLGIGLNNLIQLLQ
jgi:arginine exporter protein ArgO